MTRPTGLRKRRPSGKTSAKALARIDRDALWLEQRKSGMTYEQIAADHLAKTGERVATNSVWKRIQKWLQETISEPAEELRALELNRLDKLLASYWRLATDLGDMQAAVFCLKVIEARAKMQGLYPTAAGAAVQVNVGTPGTTPEITLDDVLPLLAAAGYRVVREDGAVVEAEGVEASAESPA